MDTHSIRRSSRERERERSLQVTIRAGCHTQAMQWFRTTMKKIRRMHVNMMNLGRSPTPISPGMHSEQDLI